MKQIDHGCLRAVVREIVSAAGSEGDEPALVADNLVYANLTGHDSHGVGMLPAYMASVSTGELNPNKHAEVVVDQGAMLTIEGHAGYGQVIGLEATDLAIDRAREHGVCVMAVRNSYHLCRIGAWGERCAQAGLISMHHVNGIGHQPLVTPYRGTEARYSTNPYCCTMPGTDNNPHLVLDFATTVLAMGKIRVAKNKAETLPDGVIFDAAGRPSTDPNDMFVEPRGSIRPVGEHKGYCLALLNELLAGVVSGGGTNRPATMHENHTIINNMLSVLIDPFRLIEPDAYNGEMDASLEYVKSARAERPDEPVLLPGDPERETFEERVRNGIPIDDQSWREVQEAGALFGVTPQRIDQVAGLAG